VIIGQYHIHIIIIIIIIIPLIGIKYTHFPNFGPQSRAKNWDVQRSQEAAALKDMLALASPGSPRAAGTTATAGTAGTSTLPSLGAEKPRIDRKIER